MGRHLFSSGKMIGVAVMVFFMSLVMTAGAASPAFASEVSGDKTEEALISGAQIEEAEAEEESVSADIFLVSPDDKTLVNGAAWAVDKNDKSNYVGDGEDCMYKSYLTGSAVKERELFSAIHNDIILGEHEGKWYEGHEVIYYPEASFSGEVVFGMDYLPAELSPQFYHYYKDTDDVWKYTGLSDGAKLYAWEYEPFTAADGSQRYRRVKTVEIPSGDYELTTEDGKIYTDNDAGGEAGYTPQVTLPGKVCLNGSKFDDPSHPIAIVALAYNAAKDAKTVDALAAMDQEMWEGDPVFNTRMLGGTFIYQPSYNYYRDDIYTADAMGSFSLNPYDYYINEGDKTLTLYGCGKYNGMITSFLRGYTEDMRDTSGKSLNIGKWEIPAAYKGYMVRLYNHKFYGSVYPDMASELIIDAGVAFPDDCSNFLKKGSSEQGAPNPGTVIIKGDTASVGANIKDFSNFFAGGTYNKLDVKALDTSGAVNMSEMFKGVILNPVSDSDVPDLSRFDTSNVEDMSSMFEDMTITGSSTKRNINVSGFNTGKVRSFRGMFRGYHVTDNQIVRHYYTKVDTGSFDTSNAESMAFMFCDMYMTESTGCGTLDISNFRFTSKLTDMQGMFAGNISYETPGLVKIILPADMDTSNVTDMSYLFCADDSLREIVNLSALDTDNVLDITGMFGKYMDDRLFGSMSAKKNLPVTYWTSKNTGSWINDRLIAEGTPGSLDPKYYHQEGATGFFGPALETLDLSGFDTRKVRYAYGAFCWMPNLKEIKWGENTTFENVTDANCMFVLPGLKKLDLTGRKFQSLKYAFSMVALENAEELILGEDSLNLSGIVGEENYTISAPKLRTADFRKVVFGDNARAFSEHTLYNENGPGGLVAATELYFPAMPLFEKAAALPASFKDEGGAEYTALSGGNTGELHLTSADDPGDIAIESVNVIPVIDIGTSGGGWMMNKGEKERLTATVYPLRADQRVTWSSSDSGIATVDSDGLVTAVGGKEGGAKVTITATSVKDETKNGTFEITVFLAEGSGGGEPIPPQPGAAPVTKLMLDRTSLSMGTGKTVTLKVSALCDDGDTATKPGVKWSTSKPSVATVNESTGEITAVASGTAKITATATDGSKKKVTCSVKVGQSITGISISQKQNKNEVVAGKTLALTAALAPAKPKPIVRTLVWKSSDPQVAVVNSKGKVTGISEGNATITAVPADSLYDATDAEKPASFEVKVTRPSGAVSPNGIVIKKGKAELESGKPLEGGLAVGKSVSLKAYDKTTGKVLNTKSVVFYSSDETRISVTSVGKIKAMAATMPGESVTVTAVSLADPSIKAYITIDTYTAVKSITLNTKKLKIKNGSTGVMTVTKFNPAGTTNRKVKWYTGSSDIKLAILSKGQTLSDLKESDFREAVGASAALETDIGEGERIAYLAVNTTKKCVLSAVSSENAKIKASCNMVVIN